MSIDAARVDAPGVLGEQGFLHVPSLGVTQGDLDEVRALLDPLYERFSSLRGLAHDLAAGGRVLEVNQTIGLEPRLRETALFRAASELAGSLLGGRPWLSFDHAIYKPAGASAPTPWHQDGAYALRPRGGIAVWLPLQDTAARDGCVQYVQGSHLRGLLPHQEQVGADGKRLKTCGEPTGGVVDAPCRAGGALVHGQLTVHGARANLGAGVRRAWVLDFLTGTRAQQWSGRAAQAVWTRWQVSRT